MDTHATSNWPEEKPIAISLCYDGALPEHLDVVAPLLGSLGFKATFFLSPSRVLDNIQGWQTIAEDGHEIANGSLFGVSDNGRLPNWTLRMVEQDLHMTQEFLSNVFWNSESVSFAYPGQEPFCSQGPYRDVVNEEFQYARGGDIGFNALDCDSRYLKYEDLGEMSEQGFELWKHQFLTELGRSETVPKWHILRFGRMFDGESNRSLLLHELVVALLADQADRVWIAPLADVAKQLSSLRVLPSRL